VGNSWDAKVQDDHEMEELSGDDTFGELFLQTDSEAELQDLRKDRAEEAQWRHDSAAQDIAAQLALQAAEQVRKAEKSRQDSKSIQNL